MGVSWSNFSWEDGYSDPRPVEHLHEPIVFARGQYETVFTGASERVDAFPYDELAHRGRQFSGLGSGDRGSHAGELRQQEALRRLDVRTGGACAKTGRYRPVNRVCRRTATLCPEPPPARARQGFGLFVLPAPRRAGREGRGGGAVAQPGRGVP